MGKKTKTGKTRKDKFYLLAKEAGYRSRAAFKLLQLNRNYRFLEKSRVCIDLCAAPGGWLQVAATHMPMSSVIIGVDLVPIKSIANVITHVNDITTDKCRQTLKKDLVDNKADLVLHDGAPNVGKNWIYDAYQQNMLVLQSFKLASEFLKKGGWFITKVFRSKDYYSIMWVFQQFFKKVESTKPQASRNESAEIFVICQNYKAPEKIDPKFFDIKYVFSEVENAQESKKGIDIFKNTMNQRHRGGYEDGDYTLYHKLNATDFINGENFIELLAKSNEIVLDDEKIANHPLTDEEIKQCVKDLKILGKNEIKNLLKWRTKLRTVFKKSNESEPKIPPSEKVENQENLPKNGELNKGESDEEDTLETEIKDALYTEKKIDKKKKKKEQKEKRKLKEKMSLKMEFQNDIVDHNQQGDNEIFNLNKIKTKKQLMELQNSLPGLAFSDDDDEHERDANNFMRKRNKKSLFSKFDQNDDLEDRINQKGSNSDDENEFSFDENDLAEENGDEVSSEREEENPLLADFDRNSKTSLWFNKDAFDFLNDTNEIDNNLLNSIELNETNGKRKKRKHEINDKDDDEDDDDDDDDENEVDEETKLKRLENKKKLAKFKKEDDEEEENERQKKIVKLTPEELALGEVMINSKKSKNQLIDDSFNKFSKFGDTSALPTWFQEDEERHCKKMIPLPKESLNEYKQKQNDINARPIKKVVEAEARKKMRLSKKLNRARKKAESLSENQDLTDKERNREIKSIYKRAGLLSKKKVDIKYVVSKKGGRGKRPAMGQKEKGPYRLVDKRLKKDKVPMKKKMKQQKKSNKKMPQKKSYKR